MAEVNQISDDEVDKFIMGFLTDFITAINRSAKAQEDANDIAGRKSVSDQEFQDRIMALANLSTRFLIGSRDRKEEVIV